MKDEVIVITGATGGIGSTISKALFEIESKLVLVSRNQEKLKSLSSSLNDSLYFSGDVTDPIFVDSFVTQTIEKYQKIDGFIHCIGSIFLKPTHLTSLEEWNQALLINLTSAFIVTKSVLKPMLSQKKGSVVLFSSVAAQTGMVNHPIISAAKAGIEGFIKSNAATYASRGIRFNGVAPSLTETPLSELLLKNESVRKASESMHPLSRLGKPEDISNATLFLLDSKNSWITGQILNVDGGLGALRLPAKI